MVEGQPGPVTQLLHEWSCGDRAALDKLLPLVYDELRRIAASCLRRERRNHTLVATALVHEAYLRLVGQRAPYENRSQFFAIAASVMRRVLVDYARARVAAKRPRPELRITLDQVVPSVAPPAVELLSLDLALDELAALDAHQERLVELRYFGGLTVDETAEVLGISPRTVAREWNVARAWLYRRLTRPAPLSRTADVQQP